MQVYILDLTFQGFLTCSSKTKTGLNCFILSYFQLFNIKNQNMKTIVILMALFLSSFSSQAQKLLSRNGHIWFYSSTPFEEIEAHNRAVASILNIETGDVQVSLLIKSFEFKRALMQEHFNENYMESDKYPKSTFKGKISDPANVKINENGIYKTTADGELTIHNVTKTVSIPVEIKVDGKEITANTKFKILPGDYDINIPELVRDKIAKEIEVTIEIPYTKM